MRAYVRVHRLIKSMTSAAIGVGWAEPLPRGMAQDASGAPGALPPISTAKIAATALWALCRERGLPSPVNPCVNPAAKMMRLPRKTRISP